MTRRCIPCLMLLALAGGAWAQSPPTAHQHASDKAASAKPEATITGRLAHENKTPVLKANGKTVRLLSSDDYANAILHEPRFVGRELRLEGRWKSADTFDADRLFSVRDGKLFKVIYYCDVCNITSYKPGLCDCCQQPTEVREVLHNPQGVY